MRYSDPVQTRRTFLTLLAPAVVHRYAAAPSADGKRIGNREKSRDRLGDIAGYRKKATFFHLTGDR